MQKRIPRKARPPADRPLDWDELRLFLAVVRGGNLSHAARELGVTQPTVGRKLAALEARVGSLFERTPAGLHPSALGRRILDSAERMEAAALELERRLAATSDKLEGHIRVTALEWVASWLVAPALARFAASHPNVTLELVADARPYSLPRREADIAIRFARFEQLDVVQRRIGTIESALYASADYLTTHGWPDFAKHFAGHSLLLLHDAAMNAPGFAWLRDVATAARTTLKTNSPDALLRAAEAGAGITVLARVVGDTRPSLVRIETPQPFPARELWLGVHKDLRTTARVRALMDELAAEIGRALSAKS